MSVFNSDDEIAKNELIWFFNYSDSDCGIKSNWNAMVRSAILPGGTWQDPYNPFILRAIDKRRDIQKAYYALPQNLQNCLYAIYGGVPLPFAVEKLYKDLAGAVMFVKLKTIPELIKMCERSINFKASAEDKIQISQFRMEAIALKKRALYEYKQARKNQQD